jgi:hypothetical protein
LAVKIALHQDAYASICAMNAGLGSDSPETAAPENETSSDGNYF